MSRWVITSTWGQHHVLAENEYDAEAVAEAQLGVRGYADPNSMILDGLNAEYSKIEHGDWQGPTPSGVVSGRSLRHREALNDMEHAGSWGDSPADGEDQYGDD